MLNRYSEIYCDGVMEVYKLARMRLELIGGLPMTGGEYYFEKNKKTTELTIFFQI